MDVLSLAVSCTWHCKLNGSTMFAFNEFFLPRALFCKRKYIFSGLFATRDTVTCHSKCKEKRKSYNDSYLNFIFLFHFPAIVIPLYSPWLTVTLSWHAANTWTVHCDTWYNNSLPCFWFYGKSDVPEWKGASMEWRDVNDTHSYDHLSLVWMSLKDCLKRRGACRR